MAIKIYKPTSPGRRIHSVTDYSVLDKRVKTPKNLIVAFKKNAGRNNQGKITVRHQGGGHRLKARVVDFLRTDKLNIPAKVQTLEYDPTRSGFISLLAYRDGEKRYILAPDGLKVGSEIVAAPRTDVSAGNRMMLRNIPVGTYVHNVQIDRTQGSSVARSAGSYAIIVATEGESTLLKFPSGEIRKVSSESYATVGQVSNIDWMYVRIGKAGRVRHMGRRPTVRGKAMNPVDHPHGGGEGHNPIGLKYPKTPWGKHALGVKTRNPKKASSKFIVKRRN
ncbi:MAG: 50S ribosomal protein L2 [Candidatus Doudnabacteria bacterium RIFCSPLOWO2_02_FULL_48_8]|uniref:Large ribosomal subunit protein uL2 n=2 Tax=Candidatus Doudnaibacteriota TaxID=1817799 RepID=A0A1F5PYI8_9BACT|nr:ribosomal protein L2 [uncultured bacterium]OGE81474.1 MAG: 50S ribosomal protein L2 [Candidatus Doudnabacteria bacterium RIFCSPHIGHO2_01_FULL_46_24]OGE94914.1 MAG: 50S ribosomal protein L2 [Candidatus Doudnabacteria bacterium RIFCSPLOWO2_01_FULL_44_21]OGE95066.1 MAG: 50S ribosomal protein L2 [Candidatus Doudnabacteria bacterium RIFCSPLOWO2_02_FULL_48_8]OGE95908.1 MAG: 50S ribosomal protein L2 [Candidatus Doudnabacteria bacterium RIFCSPHIGHO2_12_FULL_48_11]